jgi:hypothetical protein
MSRHDRGVRMPDRRLRRSAWEVIGWIVGGLLVLGLIGVIAVGVMVASAFPPLPDLVRPTGILEGSVEVEPDASSTVAVGVDVSSRAVEAAVCERRSRLLRARRVRGRAAPGRGGGWRPVVGPGGCRAARDEPRAGSRRALGAPMRDRGHVRRRARSDVRAKSRARERR